jgi:arylsulfatase A-like enzyme
LSQDGTTEAEPVAGRWWRRRALLLPWLAATGILSLFHAAFLAWRSAAFGGGWQMLFAFTQLGLMLALATMISLVPVLLLVRRGLRATRRIDVAAASWAACAAAVTALSVWTLASVWAAGPWIPEGFRVGFSTLVALLAGLFASWLALPRKLVDAGAAVMIGLVILVFLPIGNAPQGPGLGATGLDTAAEPPASPRADAPDVVLISVDTLRADRLAAYGDTRSLTPEMNRFLAEGVVFEHALAASPWTVPSVASMLTGLPTAKHGAGLAGSSGPTFARSPLDGDQTTLAERFAAAGYRTRAVVANGFLTPWSGMAQGFDQFLNPFADAGLVGLLYDMPLTRGILALTPAETWGDYRAEAVTNRALEWLAEDDSAPLFLWVHYIDPHVPLQRDPSVLDPLAVVEMTRQASPPVLDDGTVVGDTFVATEPVRGGSLWLGPEDRLRLQDYYDLAVVYTDEHLGRVLQALRERSGDRPVVAALTADHGEEFWDHGQFEHGHDYYAEVTRVPLGFWSPGVVPAGVVVPGSAGLVDVAPTLLTLAGLDGPDPQGPDEGRSLVAAWDEPEAWQTPLRFSEGNLYGLPAALLQDGLWKYLLRANGVEELFDAAADPGDTQNLVREHPDLVARYRTILQPRLDALVEAGADGGPAEIDPEAAEALRALGYIQ